MAGMLLAITILHISVMWVKGNNKNETIIRTDLGQIYPFTNSTYDQFCFIQNSRILFKNDEVYIVERDDPFFVSIQPNDHMANIELTGMSRSIWNNKTMKHQANIIAQTMCGNTKGSTSVSFVAKLIFTPDDTHNTVQNVQNQSNKQEQQTILIEGIIFCASMLEIQVLGTVINELILISCLLINMLVEVPIITRFSYTQRTVIITLFLLTMLLPSLLANISLLFFFISLGIFGVSRDAFVSMPVTKKKVIKLIWYLLIFIQINYICFEMLQIKNYFLLYIFDFCAFQIAFSIFFMLVYVTRLRGAVYLIFIAYFVQFAPEINSFQIFLPTIFNLDCKINSLTLITFLTPVLSFMNKVKDDMNIFGGFIFCISLNQSMSFQIKYTTIVTIFFIGMLAQMRVKGAFQTIKFRR